MEITKEQKDILYLALRTIQQAQEKGYHKEWFYLSDGTIVKFEAEKDKTDKK